MSKPTIKPICFMVMPFGKKDTGAAPPAPAKINFDALWEKAFRPLIEDMGYIAVRADQDLGGSIIKDMLERLYFSDLVLADLTIPNGNVYYEVGVRHALKDNGCVLVSANWSSQLFDLNQIRQARYPLPEGEITDGTVAAIHKALEDAVHDLAAGETPVYQTLPGLPSAVDESRASVIRDQLEALSKFQASVRAIRAAPTAERAVAARQLAGSFPPAEVRLPSVAIELVQLLRDFVDWTETLDYIEKLPKAIQDLPSLREQHCLARSKQGDHLAAIGALEELVKTSGETSERQGLLGGRYKRLYRDAVEGADKQRFLGKAIEHYNRGMILDLNDYFPSCNLPSLYRERGRKGDDARAKTAATVARLACERAIELKRDDSWTRPTLLGLAFFEGDLDEVEELCDRVIDEGAAAWQLETTLKDLAAIIATTRNEEVRQGLQAAYKRLQDIAKP
jgi:hypothetical protein